MSEKKTTSNKIKWTTISPEALKHTKKKMKSSQAYNSAEEAVVTAIAKTKQ